MYITLVVPRAKKRLRKRHLGRPTIDELKYTSTQFSNDPSSLGIPDTDTPEEVVRVGYCISRTQADQLRGIVSDVLRATGNPCSASEVVRVAIGELAQRPISEVVGLFQKLLRQKPGRRPKPK